MDFLTNLDPNFVDDISDILSPFFTFLKSYGNIKVWIYYIQLGIAIYLLVSYGLPWFNGVQSITKTNDTFRYTMLNLAKVLVFAYLIWWNSSSIYEGFDYYVVGSPVQTPLIEPNPNLDIQVVASPPRTLPGTRIQYTLTLTNVGNVKAENIIMTNRVPEYTEFVSSPRGIYRNGYVSWYNINLSPQEFIQVNYVVLVDEDLDVFDVPQIINNEYLAYNAA